MQSTIDAEIHGCINALEKLKIYYLDKREITLRTDCQAIISFYNKTNSNKASRVRWMKFADAVTGTGVQINIEHIEGKQNALADALSRLINLCLEENQYQLESILKITTITQEVLTEGLSQEAQMLAHLLNQSPLLQQSTRTNAVQKPTRKIQQVEEVSYPLARRFTMEEEMPLNPQSMSNMNMDQYRRAHEKEHDCKTQWYAGDLRNDPKQAWFGHLYGSFSTIQQEAQNQEIQTQGKRIISEAKNSSKPKSPIDHKMKGLAINCLIENPSERAQYKFHPIHGMIPDDSSDDDDDGTIVVDPGWDDWCVKRLQVARITLDNARRARL